MTPKKTAKPKWPAMVQLVKNATGTAKPKKTSAAVKRNESHFNSKTQQRAMR